MNNPFTSDIYATTWEAHYSQGKKGLSFDFIKEAKFTKKGSLPLYINLGRNFTNGMTYKLNPAASDFNGKVALIHDVHTRDKISYEGTGQFKLIKISQYHGCSGDIGNYANGDEVLTAKFNSSRSRYNFRSRQKQLEKSGKVEYKVYYGDIEKDTYDTVMSECKDLIAKRFDDKSTHNTVLPMWDFYHSLIYPLIIEKMVALNVIYNNGQPIAMSINFIHDKTMIVAIRTFDIEFNKLNIGNLEVLKLIEWGIENKMQVLDFSKGEAEYKKRWTDAMYEFHHHIIYDSKSLVATGIAKSLANFFRFKQYLRDRNINEWYVRFIHLKKKILFQN